LGAVAVGVQLLVVAAILALKPIYLPGQDTYCGRVFYDRQSGCQHRMAVQSTWTAIAATAGVAALVTPAVIPSGRSRRSAWLLEIALGLMAAAFLVVGLNRMLQPYEGGEYCGSLLNRHTTPDPARERRCDDLLWPHRRAAIVSFSGSALATTGGIALGVGRRRQNTDRHAARQF
jgi:hypothetical protein